MRRVILLVCIATLLMVVPGAFAQGDPVQATVSAGRLNVRSAPSIFGSQVVATLTQGTDINVYGLSTTTTEGVRWAYITGADGVAGWALSAYVDFPEGYDTGALAILDEAPDLEVDPDAAPTIAPQYISTNADEVHLMGGRPRNDGRINEVDDLGPYAIYCVAATGNTTRETYRNGGIAVFNSDTETVQFFARYQDIRIAERRLNRLDDPDALSYLVRSENGFQLYILQSGALQINGVDGYGVPFALQWSDCKPDRVIR